MKIELDDECIVLVENYIMYEGDEVMGVDRDMRKDYQLAGYSVDRTIAFYSPDGSMESLFNRDWVAHQDGFQWKEQPIYVGMHDPRAVVDHSTIATPTNQDKDNES